MITLFKSQGPLDRAFEAVLGYEIRKLNTHLPKQKRTMSELLKSTDPVVKAVDGSLIVFRKAELEELSRIVPKEYQDRLMLPIILFRRMDLGKSVYTVTGELIEEFIVKKILGMADGSYQDMPRDRTSFYLYRPQVVELLRKYHTLFVIGFGIPTELSDYALRRD
jgi:uncharacterized protein (UPF0216 family)